MTALSTALHGAATRQQMLDTLGRYGLDLALRAGTLIQPWPGVLVDAARATEPLTRAAAAILWSGPDSVLAGPTAAALHGCYAAQSPEVHVMLRYGRGRGRRGPLIVHNGWFPPEDVTTVEGLPVLTLSRAVADMLCDSSRRTAIATLDQALAMRPESERAAYHETIAEHVAARRDRRGTRRAGVLLELGTGKPESPPESWLLLAIADAGLPLPEMQFRLLDIRGRERYRLDFSWPQLRIAVEYDGYETHAERQAADAARDEDLRRRGWIVLRVHSADTQAFEKLIDELRGALRQRRC